MNTRFSTMVGVAAGLLMGVTATVQAQFRYTTSGGTVTITGYTGPGGDVVIPDTIDEKPVTTVGDRAFSGCTGLTSVTIGNSVTSHQHRGRDVRGLHRPDRDRGRLTQPSLQQLGRRAL